MAGQKARIDKDSNEYLSKNARPEAEAETAYDSNKDIEGEDLSKDRNGNGEDVFRGSTKKDRSRKADQVTTGTEGDMGSGLQKVESSNPFASVLNRRFFSEAENPGVAQAPATSDSPSLGMMAVNNTDFRQPQADVKSVLEGIAIQAAEAFEMLDENSNVPDAITNELQNTAKAITKIYEFASKGQSQDGTGETSDTPAVGKDAAVGKPGVNEEVEELEEISMKTAIKTHSLYSSPDEHPDTIDKAMKVRQHIQRKWGSKAGEHADDAAYVSHYGRTEPGKTPSDRLVRDKLADRSKTSYRMTSSGKANKQDLKARFRKEEVEELDEKLIGKQKNIDANKNGRLDAHDFKLLRAKKTMKEATDIVFKTLLKDRLDADN